MHRAVAIVLAAIGLIATNGRAASLEEAVGKVVRRFQAAGRLSGVLVVDRLKSRHTWAVGLADDEQGIANAPSTVFLVASLSKSFVAAAILNLRDAGKLALDDTLREHLPQYREGARVTLLQLLTHTS